MAQPLFDQHPLEEYFRNTGDFAEPMPGGSPDFVWEEYVSIDNDHSSTPIDMPLPSFVVWAIQVANELLQTSSCASHENSFSERFKYDVISSSLLSSSLAAPSSAMRRSFHLDLPGKLDDAVSEDNERSTSDSQSSQNASSSFSLGQQLTIALLSLAVVVISTGYFFLAMIPLASAIYVRYAINADVDRHASTTQTTDALGELILAGNVWDFAVNEAIMLIENEERSIFYGPTSSQAPSSALRMALQSSLHTTQTQCDNVRQLLSALTSPTTLSQLAEMYAPPSPVRPTLSLVDGSRSPSPTSSSVRPLSHPMANLRSRTTSLPSSAGNKRATWNGSYAALALAGSPTAHIANRRSQNRRSDVMSLFQPMPVGSGLLSSVSAPVTPQPLSPVRNGVLEDVAEEEDYVEEELESKTYFGAAALDLQRKRKSAGLDVFGAPPHMYTLPRSPIRSSGNTQPLQLHPSTISSSSRLTSVHTTRHPLSLSGLHLALHGALAAKRYSCSHLLALRFNEDEDESYWENVRSIMALLTSSFSDASTRLIEALDDAEKRRKKDERPTPPRGNSPTPNGRIDSHSREHSISPLRNEYNSTSSLQEIISFAPMPSNMARLAGHIEAISTAMTDARGHIDVCVAALRHTTSNGSRPNSVDGLPSVQDHPAFQAYDRLRKELGFALRECERGRERLLDIISPRPFPGAPADDDEASPNTPGLKHDSGSESSEKGPVSPNVQLGSGLGLTLSFGGHGHGEHGHSHDHDHEQLDDATAHLLLTASSRHLPPPGVEQVFEAESGSGASFARERSKLSREERIRMMKARRVSGVPLGLQMDTLSLEERAERPGRERWGPGGEVVQELKDVIWKVGEKRRKMSQQLQQPSGHAEVDSDAGRDRDPSVPELVSKSEREAERETSILVEVDVGSPVCVVDGAELVPITASTSLSTSSSNSSSSPLPSPPSSPPLTPSRLTLPTSRSPLESLRTVSLSVLREDGSDMS